jgi:dTMP kinase
MAYQGFGHRLGSELVKSVQAAAIGDFRPDLTLLLDVPVDLGLSRARDRGSVVSDRYERMDETFHDRVRSGFLAIARAELERVAVLDATAPADDVAAVVWRVVARKFGLGDG